MKHFVLFVFRGPSFPKDEFLPGREQIVAKLDARGIAARMVMLSDDPFGADGITAHTLVSEQAVSGTTEKIPYGEAAVVINRTGKRMPDDVEDRLVTAGSAIVNRNEVRALLRDKNEVQRRILGPLGLGAPTAPLRSPGDSAAFIRENPADEYIVKPNDGAFGLFIGDVVRLAPDDIDSHVAGKDFYGKAIIQPAFTFTRPFPASIRPLDEDAETLFAERNADGTVKEIRLYSFYADGQTFTYPIARILTDKSYWFFVRPEDIPVSVTDAAARVLAATAAKTASRTLFLSIDFGYGTLADEEPDFHIIEANGQAPYVIGYDLSRTAADGVRDRLADMIAAAVKNHAED